MNASLGISKPLDNLKCAILLNHFSKGKLFNVFQQNKLSKHLIRVINNSYLYYMDPVD